MAVRAWLAVVVCLAISGVSTSAQGRGGQTPAPPAPGAPGAPAAAPAPPPTPRAGAPIDLTGYWVSIVSEDWRWRMVTPPKGDYASIPITQDARAIGDAWDPAKDEAAGDACKAYGAPGLMRLPTRLNITWQDDTTMKVDTDAGRQTRLLHFGEWKSPGGDPTIQGDSTAQWETGRPARGAGPARAGNLKTVTTRLKPGYLRKNGVPYSEKATLTEYWDLLRRPNGEEWLVITTLVEDPAYLRTPWITSLNFKKESNGSKWDPTPCSVK